MNKYVMPIMVFMLSACQTVAPLKTTPKSTETVGSETVEVIQHQKTADEIKPLFDRALWFSQHGQFDEAMQQFEQIMERDPKYPKIHTNLALLHLEKMQIESAKNLLLIAIELNHNDAVAYNHLAIIARRQGQFEQAKGYYEKALEYQPEYANAHLNYAILLDVYLQQLQAALEHYERYQQLLKVADERVKKWIIDLKNRIKTQA